MPVLATAPDFELPDVQGQPVRLSQFRGQKNVVLVFLRGFM
jgi:mycoredoxin-dependent peroxiredoxin